MDAYLIVSGLPASGKTRLGRYLACALGWPLVDKDDYLETLFQQHRCENLTQRQQLSRTSDTLFQDQALRYSRAVLVSHWRPLGSDSQSGTALDAFMQRHCLEVYCHCELKLACQRFRQRQRHPGHCDHLHSEQQIRQRFTDYAKQLPLSAKEPNRGPQPTMVRASQNLAHTELLPVITQFLQSIKTTEANNE